ncbi:short-chain dehydrogenase reductase [Phlyctema vagabunda]|uniref:Short-chain dehydrogenase reductase n=1 Tax=Phlyctema vagabunda TaxID=108571 RepID=A0ABR4P6V8_9HELO
MVTLSDLSSSNSLIASTFPAGLVAVFVGATSGIGEITLKKLAKYSPNLRVYFIGRSQDAADRIVAECKALNPSSEYIFIRADISLIRVVDKVCNEIKAKESALNLLFMSAGVPNMDRAESSEHLHLLAALNYYSRIRFIMNLLPLIQKATSLRRIVTVGGGSRESLFDPTDFPALRVPLPQIRGHLSTLITLGVEAVAKTAPAVTFVHDHPGTVRTPLLNYMSEETLKTLTFVPLDECGERHVYLATSARFPPSSGASNAVPLKDGDTAALGATGEIGSGVYSIASDCESASSTVMELLSELRRKGMVEEVWRHTENEFKRIMEQNRNANME